MKTFKKITRENTGSHFLDSGGAYGYKYQQKLPKAKLTWDTCKEFKPDNTSITVPLHKHLNDTLEIDKKMTKILDKIRIKEDYPYFSDLGDLMALETGLEVRRYESTYNNESDLDQGFEYIVLSESDYWYEGGDDVLVLIRTHNGCDIRGGYSEPVACRMNSNGKEFFDVCYGISFENSKKSKVKYETDHLQALDEKFQCGYTSNPSYAFTKVIKKIIGLNRSKEVLTVELNTGEIVDAYVSNY